MTVKEKSKHKSFFMACLNEISSHCTRQGISAIEWKHGNDGITSQHMKVLSHKRWRCYQCIWWHQKHKEHFLKIISPLEDFPHVISDHTSFDWTNWREIEVFISDNLCRARALYASVMGFPRCLPRTCPGATSPSSLNVSNVPSSTLLPHSGPTMVHSYIRG